MCVSVCVCLCAYTCVCVCVCAYVFVLSLILQYVVLFQYVMFQMDKDIILRSELSTGSPKEQHNRVI